MCLSSDTDAGLEQNKSMSHKPPFIVIVGNHASSKVMGARIDSSSSYIIVFQPGVW